MRTETQTTLLDWDIGAAIRRRPVQEGIGIARPGGVLARPTVSIIIPAYNEASRLPKSLPQIKAFLESIPITCEVIIVNDGSVDATEAVVKAAMEEIPQLRLVRGPHKGKGGAIRAGVYAARGYFVAISDADLAMPIDNFTRFDATMFSSADIVIGSRHVRGSHTVNESPLRRLMGRVFNLFVQALLLPGIKDTQCGFKVLRQEIAVTLCDYQVIDGWAFDVEWLAIARQRGYPIREAPITVVYDNDESRINPMRDSLNMFNEILRVRRNVRAGVYRVQPDLERATEYDSASVLFEGDGIRWLQAQAASDDSGYAEVRRGEQEPRRLIIPGPLDGAPTKRVRAVSVSPAAGGGQEREAMLAGTDSRQMDAVSASGLWPLIRRFFSYLAVGGFSALINLVSFWLLLHKAPFPANVHIHYLAANIVANEISTVANFVPNDLITFRNLPGHSRYWFARFIRFHITALAGLLVTLGVSQLLFELGLPGLIPQMTAIVVALGFNFTLHHLFTYRKTASNA